MAEIGAALPIVLTKLSVSGSGIGRELSVLVVACGLKKVLESAGVEPA